MRYWAGNRSDFEEKKIQAFHFDTHEVCVVKVDGNFKAFRNACPHQHVPLEDALIKDNWVVCCLHGWMFDMDNGSCGVNPNCHLPTYKTEIDNEQVYVIVS